MLSKYSIALAENIAVSLDEDVVVTPGPILAGLNEESYGAIGYSPKWREELVEVTSEITAHSEIMEMSTTRMAEIIRGGFEMVKSYGVPLAGVIAKSAGLIYSPSHLNRISLSELQMKFTNLDNPFFNSGIYPTEVKNKSLGFDSVGMEVLGRLEFSYPEPAEVKEYLATNHPEIQQILSVSETGLGDVFWNLSNLDMLAQTFKKRGGVFDFTTVHSTDIEKLLQMYVIVSKMYSSDAPCPWLVKGTLEDYREFVSLLWNGLTSYMIKLKVLVENYRPRSLVISPEKETTFVPYKLTNDRDEANIKIISGKVNVFYTNDTISLAEKSGVGLRDVVLASLYAGLTGVDIGVIQLLGNGQKTKDLVGEYQKNLHQVMTIHANDFFVVSALNAITGFVAEHPAVAKAMVVQQDDDTISIRTLVIQTMREHIEKLFVLYQNNVKELDPFEEQDIEAGSVEESYYQICVDTVLQTDLVPTFLRLIGCGLAAEIVGLTFVKAEAESNIRDKRERLHCALIELLANRLLGQ